MSTHNRRLGAWGEQTAVDFLAGRGYEIVDRNVRTPYGEIDIVARLGELTIFVEVKARLSASMGLPEDSITARKRAHLVGAAQHYASEHGIDSWQIDAVSVEGQAGAPPRITHFENAVSE